jgi:hypothetical protein
MRVRVYAQDGQAALGYAKSSEKHDVARLFEVRIAILQKLALFVFASVNIRRSMGVHVSWFLFS